MKRTDYLAALERELRQLPRRDFQEAMDYFTEYFDEAGPENEQEVMAELGTPEEAAADLIRNLQGKPNTPQTSSKPKRSRTEISLWIILGVLASPLLFSLAALLFGILIAILAAIIAAIIFCVSLLVAGYAIALALIVLAFVVLGETIALFTSSWSAVILGLGGFFGLIGVAVLLFLLCLYLSQLLGKALAGFVKWLRNKWTNRKWGKRHEK